MIYIEVLKKAELTSFLTQLHFLDSWQELADQTQGFHILQEPDFVLTWYRHYQEQYEPVILSGKDENGKLVGLMALAWDKRHQVLTHAGNYAAEYHGWLALPEYSDSFFVESLLAVKTHFPVKKWDWNFMPPKLAFNLRKREEKRLQEAGIYLSFQEEYCPIWDLHNEYKLKKALKSSSFRSKRNRLKRRGELRFEIIEDADEAKEALRIAAKQCDFRKEAQYNKRPFHDDTKVIDFNVELIAEGDCLHCCGLWLDDKLLAFHLGATDGKSLHLGLITFDPSEYAASPGTILLAELARHLTEAGYATFDITPGGDAYKKRYANSSILIQRPKVFMTQAGYEKDKLKGRTLSYLKSLGLFEKTKKLNNYLKQEPLKALSFWPIFPKGNTRKYQLHTLQKSLYMNNNRWGLSIAKQKYEDLLLYADTCPYGSRRELLIAAYEKFKGSETLYSLVVSGELVAFGWMRKVKKVEHFKGREIEAGSFICTDFYFKHADVKAISFLAIIERMCEDVVDKEQIQVIAEGEICRFFGAKRVEKEMQLALA